MTRKISHAVAQIKLGHETELRLGNLEAQRDWGFAGDYVEAIWLMLQQDDPGTYVISTGETHSVREFCETAFAHAGLNWEDHVVQDERFMRPAEVDLLVGDSSYARATLGWKPKVDFEGLVKLMVDADLDLVSGRLRPISTPTVTVLAGGRRSPFPARLVRCAPRGHHGGGEHRGRRRSPRLRCQPRPRHDRVHAGWCHRSGSGWGLEGETWQAMDALDRYGGPTWFRLGDRDLATHLYRTQRLADGAGLAAVTGEIARAWGLELTVLPVTEDRVRPGSRWRVRARSAFRSTSCSEATTSRCRRSDSLGPRSPRPHWACSTP